MEQKTVQKYRDILCLCAKVESTLIGALKPNSNEYRRTVRLLRKIANISTDLMRQEQDKCACQFCVMAAAEKRKELASLREILDCYRKGGAR